MKKITSLLFGAIFIFGTFLFQFDKVSADNEGIFELKDCRAECDDRGKGTCTSRSSSEDTKDGIVYDCKSNSNSPGNYSTCTKTNANVGCSGKTGSAYTECIKSFIDLYCKDGTTVASLSSESGANTGGGSNFPLENGNTSAINNPNATVPQANTNYSFPTFGGGGSQSKVSSGECESGYSKSAGVCIPDNTGLSGQSIQQILSNLLFWLLAIFATIAVIAFLISGIQYLIASGNEKMAETAKRNMTYSIIGILIGLSGLIVLKAISALLNANTTI